MARKKYFCINVFFLYLKSAINKLHKIWNVDLNRGISITDKTITARDKYK